MIHENSLKAYREERPKLGARARMILARYRVGEGKGFTDRLTLDFLYPGSDNMNLVQPRITELIKGRYLKEIGKTRDHATGKTVRLVAFIGESEQRELSFTPPADSPLPQTVYHPPDHSPPRTAPAP